MGKLFSAYSLVNETCTSMDIVTPEEKDISLFSESIDFLIQEDRLLTLEKSKLYKGISEANDDITLIDESFSDYIKTIRGYISKVIAFFKKLFAKFWAKINSFILRDKYISKHKSELSKFKPEMEFEIQGYEFKFSESVPNPYAINDIKDIITEIGKTPTNADDLGKEYDYIVKSYNKLKDDKKYMDKIRKDILGTKYNISEEKYQSELFDIFVEGVKEKKSIKVNKAKVDEALAFFEDSKKLQEQTQKQCDDISKAYDEISNSLANIQKMKDAILTDIKVSDFLDPETKKTVKADKYIEAVDLFINLLAIRIDAISKAHIMAYSAKLEAIKDCFVQNKSILYGAFKQVIGKSESSNFVFDIDSLPDVSVQESIKSKLVNTIKSDLSDNEVKEAKKIFLSKSKIKKSGDIKLKIDSVYNGYKDILMYKANKNEYKKLEEDISYTIKTINHSQDKYTFKCTHVTGPTMQHTPEWCYIISVKKVGFMESSDLSFENDALYYKFLTELAVNKEKLVGLAKTSALIKEDASFEQIYSINEDAVETLKSTWQRFDAFLKRLFAKFMDYFNRIIRTNVGWLEKYKDTILNVKPDSAQVEGIKDFKTGIQNMMRLSIPTFDQVKDKVPTDITNNGDFVRTMISSYNEANNQDLSKFCVEYFEGGPETKTVDMMNMNMTDMYNYCHDVNKMNDIVSKDIKNIESGYNAILPQLKDLQNKQTQEKQQADQQKQNDKQQAQQQKQQAATQTKSAVATNGTSTVPPAQSATAKKEEFLYESMTKKERDSIPSNQFGLEKERKYPLDTDKHIYSAIKLFGHCPENRKEHLAKRISSFAKRAGIEIDKTDEVYKYAHGIKEVMLYKYLNDFFNEADQPTNNGQPQKPTGITIKSGTGTTVANNMQSTTANQQQQGNITVKNNPTENDFNALIDKLNVYKETTSTILKAKMTAIHYIYGEYMKIIKYHVHNKVGETNNTTGAQNGATNNSTDLNFNDADANQLRTLVKAVTDAQAAKDTDAETKAKEVVMNFVKGKYPDYNGTVDTIINAVK